MNDKMRIESSKSRNESIKFSVVILCIYFIFTPFEYLLILEQGTLLKFIAAAFVFLSLIYLLITKQPIRFSDPIILGPSLIIIISYLSIFWTIDIEATLKMNTTYLFLQGMFLFVYILSFNDKEQYFIRKAILIGGVAVSLYVFIFSPQILFESRGGRIALNAADPNEFAALLTLPLFVSFDEIFHSKSKWNIILFGVLLLMILLTGSRGAMIACGFTFLYYVINNFKMNHAAASYGEYVPARFKTLFKFLLIGCIIFFIIIPLLPEHISERLLGENAIIGEFVERRGRTEIWEIIFSRIIPEMPAWGYGSGCSGIILAPFWGCVKGSHNTYLHIVLEYGILGLPIFIYFLWKIFKRIKQEQDYAKICAFIAIVITVFFLDAYFKKYLWNTLMFCVIGYKSSSKNY